VNYYLGIDVGTSSSKTLVMDEKGIILDMEQVVYDFEKPYINYAEQNAEELWDAVSETIRKLLAKHPGLENHIKCIGYSGQMHGVLAVDREGNALTKAIIWCDQRSVDEVSEVYNKCGKDIFRRTVLNDLSTGFWATSLLWLKKNRPEVIEKTKWFLLPKDYVRYKMCGEFGTDYSDASSTLLFDTGKNDWAYDIIDKLGLDKKMFPVCHESFELAGYVTDECAEKTGLKKGTAICFGGGDTLMHEVGTNLIAKEQPWVSNIGTSCQVSCVADKPLYDKQFRINTFSHACKGIWMLMSANLSGGVALKWAQTNILHKSSAAEAAVLAEKVPHGCDGLIFLPYLSGGRSPHNDPKAKALFFGLTQSHDDAYLTRSVMEGVVLSLKDSYELLKEITNADTDVMIASGGGARGKLWLQLQADAFNKPIYTTVEKEQSCIGAAITAAICAGAYKSYAEACPAIVKFNDEVICPNPERVEITNWNYSIYKELYDANKNLFHMAATQKGDI